MSVAPESGKGRSPSWCRPAPVFLPGSCSIPVPGWRAEVVAPQPRLRFEVQLLGQGIVQISFLAIHEGWHPLARLNIGAPAVEIEIPAGVPAAAVAAVKAHNVEILIFDPDAPKEPALAGLLLRRDVEHQAAHFAEEFPAHVIELVVLLVEAIGVDEDHLQEAVLQELQSERKEVADRAENLLSLAVDVRQGDQVDALREVGAPEEIFVAP